MNRGPIEIEPFDHNQVFLQKAHIVVHVFLVQLGRLGRVHKLAQLGRIDFQLGFEQVQDGLDKRRVYVLVVDELLHFDYVLFNKANIFN